MTLSGSRALIDEAETLLTAIRGGVLVHLHEGVYPTHLTASLDLARLLNECAAKIDDHAIAAGADALEAWLLLLTSESGMISHTRTHSLLDQISELEVAVIAYRTRTQGQPDDLADFVDRSFLTFSSRASVREKKDGVLELDHAPVPASGTTEEAFEIDAEMIEVFREEATGLLQGIRANLDVLSGRPNDREALWEVKRNAHTLKGAAGVVGLGKLSTLAHQVEDLLGRMSESEAFSNSKLVGLLLNATACMTALADGESSPTLDAEMSALEGEFAEVLFSISDASEPTISQSEEPGTAAEPELTPDAPSPVIRKGRIVRVSLDRLDDLVKIVRSLESGRRSFKERIDDLRRQLEESYNNRLRLQAASGKIEKLDTFLTQLPKGESRWAQAEFDQITYELAETTRDASVIDTSLVSVRSGFEELYDQQRILIDRIQERLFRLRNVELGTVATRLQRTVRVTCDEEGKRAEIEIENPSIEVDTQIIDSLIEPLMHLLKNAVVHGIEPPEMRRLLGKPETGKIKIRAENDGPYFIMTVSDDGSGITNQALVDKAVASGRLTREEVRRLSVTEIRDLIFMPGLTTAEKLSLNAGRGVGMSIVRESLAAAGGTIEIETWPQRGTRFTVQLPNPFGEMSASQALMDETAEQESGLNELKILVIDDSPSVRLLTTRTIQTAGWRAESANNGIDALKKLTSMDERPNLILSDIEMPLMGGYEFIAALRSEPLLKDIPVIVVSSRAGAEDRKQALAAGALEYITKPYNESQLIALIDRLALRPQLAL
ncbi:MAG TPA: response regulator [Pyrinomonadaceae bacterium]|nr:response regulator [Pyrinomonadaceae bacterium]